MTLVGRNSKRMPKTRPIKLCLINVLSLKECELRFFKRGEPRNEVKESRKRERDRESRTKNRKRRERKKRVGKGDVSRKMTGKRKLNEREETRKERRRRRRREAEEQ